LEGVVLALETARAVEEQGELRHVQQWIRRAADEAEKSGNDERVLVLARAAANVTNAIESALVSDTAPRPAETGSIAPTLATLMSSAPVSTVSGPARSAATSTVATIPPSDRFETTIPPPASPPAISAPASAVSELSKQAGKALVWPTTSMGAIPVAVPGSIQNLGSFVVQRLDGGQPMPTGTVAAVLVLTNEIAGILELAARLCEIDRATRKR
jgi:hypothetical protein